uniref:Prolyl 3-hydroxylase family member 4 (inactive) n=1 Tax=Amphiprion percula TaxID=161767 RepID=A0A3P8TCQ9_AMPPE
MLSYHGYIVRKGRLAVLLLCVTFVFMSAAQYENYNFRNFPEEELMPLTAAYGKALDNYAAGNWTESIRYLELSLRLSEYDEPAFSTDTDLRVFWHVMMRASCLKKCRAHFPALQLPPPGREILEDFNRRSVLNNLQQAVPCAFTFLQRNPEDQEMQQLMEDYKKQYDLSGFLIDHEERPYEASFLQGVKLISSGDYSSSVEQLEETLKLYLQEYDLCQSDCEDISQLSADRDFYAVIADVYVDVLRCKLKCEENLMPNVGGYFVEKFVATVYHYLQYAYYKLNDGRSAVPCVYSYFLFEPEDQVMKQNLQYYKAYSEQWGLQTDHFTPRREAFRHYNQTVTQKQMLTFAEMYVKMSDEEAALLAPQSPDVEFEGIGDYEESFYANWRQPKGKGDAGEES